MTAVINALKSKDHICQITVEGKKLVIFIDKVTSESKWNGFTGDIILFIWQNHHITGYILTHHIYQRLTDLEIFRVTHLPV